MRKTLFHIIKNLSAVHGKIAAFWYHVFQRGFLGKTVLDTYILWYICKVDILETGEKAFKESEIL